MCALQLAEKGLQTYERDGWGEYDTQIVPERREIRPTADRGPILLCVDTSGSMRGPRETVAKALALECMRAARAQVPPLCPLGCGVCCPRCIASCMLWHATWAPAGGMASAANDGEEAHWPARAPGLFDRLRSLLRSFAGSEGDACDPAPVGVRFRGMPHAQALTPPEPGVHARAQERGCFVFAFAGPQEVRELELGTDLASVNNLLGFLEKARLIRLCWPALPCCRKDSGADSSAVSLT